MNRNFFKPVFDIINYQSKYPLPQTKAAFKALTDAIVPNTPELSGKHGTIQSFGALDLHTDEYQIWTLDHFISLLIVITNFNIYLANASAEMLNIAAGQLIHTKGNKEPVNPAILPEEGSFAALAPNDRFRAITLLEQLKVDLSILPVPFRNNPDFILSITGVITMLCMSGYYSEWSGYGSTRMETPEKRKLEHFPAGWKQVGYPGPSKGYHAFRGYLIEKFSE